MTTYVVGDLHGCADELQRLLEKLNFDERKDKLWLTGDLINRGPASLDALRLICNLGDAAVTVLGNHDLHLLGCWAGVRTARPGDTVDEILDASDGDELCQWLRQQPLMVRDGKYVLVHAGLYPGWDIDTCERRARKFESHLTSDNYRAVLESIFDGKTPCRERRDFGLPEKLRFTAAAFTRMRFVDADNFALNMREKGTPDGTMGSAIPWFEAAGERFAEFRVFSGHWAALGHRQRQWLTALDSGCVWGGSLTAVRRNAPQNSTCEDCSHLQADVLVNGR